MARRGIKCLDLLPALRAGKSDEPLYWMRNVHWTAAGHRVAAAAVEQFLIAVVLDPSGALHGSTAVPRSSR
jgi:SGNH hydrolase-like domain, acetyltransferase AlgX